MGYDDFKLATPPEYSEQSSVRDEDLCESCSKNEGEDHCEACRLWCCSSCLADDGDCKLRDGGHVVHRESEFDDGIPYYEELDRDIDYAARAHRVPK